MEEMIHVVKSQPLTFDVPGFPYKQKLCEGVSESILFLFNRYLVRQDKKQVCNILLYCLH